MMEAQLFVLCCLVVLFDSVLGQSFETCSDQKKIYRSCGTACPTGCDNRNNPARVCTKNCVSGCFCRAPYVLRDSANINSECVSPEACSGASEACPDGSAPIQTCVSGGTCFNSDYFCVSDKGICCPSCAKHRSSINTGGGAVVGRYVPTCSGQYYAADQYWGSTGEHWCVTRHGFQIPNTRTAPGQNRASVDCQQHRLRLVSGCAKRRSSINTGGGAVVGRYVPTCSGQYYAADQYWGSTGEHWCVTRHGFQIPNTRTAPGQNRASVDCQQHRLRLVSGCAKRQSSINTGGGAVVGRYVPTCSGQYYAADQYWGSTGEHWCVTRHGFQIPNTRTAPGQNRASVDCQQHRLRLVSGCAKRQSSINTGGGAVVGRYVPTCSGQYYAADQYWGSTGEHWCVTRHGFQIPNTRTAPGQNRASVDCQQHRLRLVSGCAKRRSSINTGGGAVVGRYVPTCSGQYYAADQYWGSTGEHWCVTRHGFQIPNTRTAPGQNRASVDCQQHRLRLVSGCAKRRSSINTGGGAVVGRYVPTCSGQYYAADQYWGSTGEHWCVTRHGFQIPNTRTAPGQNRASVDCQQHRLRLVSGCAKRRSSINTGGGAVVGRYVRTCSGQYYVADQYWGSTGEHWCVTRHGFQIPNTRTAPGQNRASVDCQQHRLRLVSGCAKRRSSINTGGGAVVGRYVPTCSGQYYAADQYWGSTGEHWCVTRHGFQIPNTRTAPGQNRASVDCQQHRLRLVSGCAKRQSSINKGGGAVVGRYVPTCSGQYYAADQYWGSTGEHWCVTRHGFQIPNTRTAPGQNRASVDCQQHRLRLVSGCAKRRSSINTGGGAVVGRYVPTCSGQYYAADQYWGSTGEHWCVTRHGFQIPNTRTAPGQNRASVDCQQHRLRLVSGCAKRRSSINTGGRAVVGRYVPTCSGQYYAADQYWGSTGEHWCVTRHGFQIPNTRTAPGQNRASVDCQQHRLRAVSGGGVSSVTSVNVGGCALKTGACPPVSTISSNVFSSCVCDNDCTGTQKCCTTGIGGRQCVPPVGQGFVSGGQAVKPGFCPPAPNTISPFLQNTCTYDHQCFGTDKCCFQYSGRTCTRPSEAVSVECSANERNATCQNTCPATCDNPNPPPCSTIRCSPGCECSPGYIRESAHPEARCILPSQCANRAQSGDCNDIYKEYKACGPSCPEGCNGVGRSQAGCSLSCVPGCFCKQGYLFEDSLNWRNSRCVRRLDCPTQTVQPVSIQTTGELGGGTVSSQCSDDRKEWKVCGCERPSGCDAGTSSNQLCAQCVQGCFCKQPYVFLRSADWRNSGCVLKSECPPKSGQCPSSTREFTNLRCEIDGECPGEQKCCQDPRVSASFGATRHCLCPDANSRFESTGTVCNKRVCGQQAQTFGCTVQPGCYCVQGYVLENSGPNARCIPASQCSSFGTFGVGTSGISISPASGQGSIHRSAIAALTSTRGVSGTIRLGQEGDGVRLTGTIRGLPSNRVAITIHEYGDCSYPGNHFNPEQRQHGDLTDYFNSHAGDMGNLATNSFGLDQSASVNILNRKISFSGLTSVIGRSIVVHERADDLGRGFALNSKTDGNSGPAIACGVIGIAQHNVFGF